MQTDAQPEANGGVHAAAEPLTVVPPSSKQQQQQQQQSSSQQQQAAMVRQELLGLYHSLPKQGFRPFWGSDKRQVSAGERAQQPWGSTSGCCGVPKTLLDQPRGA